MDEGESALKERISGDHGPASNLFEPFPCPNAPKTGVSRTTCIMQAGVHDLGHLQELINGNQLRASDLTEV